MTEATAKVSPSDPDDLMTPRSSERAPGLLLVGHGSSRNPNARRPTERLAAQLAARGGWSRVGVAFWKEAPSLREALAEFDDDDVVVVPNFAAEGIFTRQKIPAELEAIGHPGKVALTKPVGAHPRMEDIIRRRAAEAVRRAGADPTDTALLLVGHGSGKPGGASATAYALAERLSKGCACRTVAACFIEEEPLVEHWDALTDAATVVVLPLLIADGMHGSEDLPPLFGLTAADVVETVPPLLGPMAVRDRTVWYWRGIGSDPDVLGIIEEMAHAAL